MYTTQTLSTLAVAMLAMAPAVQSHMIMAQPKPFGNPNNSPLDPSGSDYPCKITGGAAGDGPNNDFAVGSTQQLSFSGSAVHGGGSCQLAVTTDKNPTKDSKFKVIHSIEGGCPGVGSPSEFSFTVPDALPNGEAVFAWSWFNHIGNREMYMNCAYITISGGKDDTSAFEALPDLALANIAVGTGASCKTSESFDYTFSGVGKAGDTVDKVGSGPFKDLCGGEASAGTGSGDSGSGTGNAGEQAPADDNGSGSGSGSGGNSGLYTPGAGEGGAAPTSAAAEAPAATQAPVVSSAPAQNPAPTGAVTSTLRTLVTVTGTAPVAPAPTAPANGSTPASPTSAPAADAPAAAPTGGASGGSGTCSSEGAVVCNGESQFGLCNGGQVVWQAVAAGTKCSNGQIAKREYTHRIQRRAI